MNNLTNHFLKLSRFHKQIVMALADAVMLLASLWAAFSLRLGEWYIPDQFVVFLFLAVPFVSIPIFIRFGLYRAIIRYIGFKALWAVVQAVSLYALVLGMLVLLSGIQGVPRSVTLINWFTAILFIGGSRMIARWWFLGIFSTSIEKSNNKNVVIYGAGAAGIQLATALVHGRESTPLGFIDDNKALQGSVIQGLKVYNVKELSRLVDEFGVQQVLLAMPSLSRSRRRDIVNELDHLPVNIQTIPGMADLVSGKAKVDEIREVEIEDLLGRDSVKPDEKLFDACIKDKSVMVTGAGGSIGSELCRQIITRSPKQLILFEQSEFMLFEIERELEKFLHQNNIPCKLVPILGNVLNTQHIAEIIQLYGIQTIYHAAAYKHVPLVEYNMFEGIRNNIFGTLSTAETAKQNGVETFILISTDKAVRPTNVMGASKRFAELILQGLAKETSSTRFSMVRFGNVLGSSGSVVPVFREQIKQGGPVTVTHPEIIRYFMTIPEAAQLVIQAGAMGVGGDVFVLDMGEPVKIAELAKKMIHLMGFSIEDEKHPDGDIQIEYTGLRPGEKLYEELLIGENATGTSHPRILRAEEESFSWEAIETYLKKLESAIAVADFEAVRELFIEVVSGYVPQGDIEDLVWRQKKSLLEPKSVVKFKDYRPDVGEDVK